MNIKASTLRTIFLLSLGTVGLTGCGTDGSYNKDFFPPTDGNRRVDQIADAQADKGAQEDATLQAIHFDGKKLNSLGCEKLDRMIPDDPDADITVYVNLTDSDIATARKTDVIAYLGEWGIPSSHVKIETGENPDNRVASEEQILNLPKADTGEAAGGSSSGSSSGGSNGSGAAGTGSMK
jgi:hypothetical protein